MPLDPRASVSVKHENNEDKSKRSQRRARRKAHQKELKQQEAQMRTDFATTDDDEGTVAVTDNAPPGLDAGSIKQEMVKERELEYVPEEPKIDEEDPSFDALKGVFEAFNRLQQAAVNGGIKTDNLEGPGESTAPLAEEERKEEGDKPLSKKKQKKLNRLSIAELKQLVARPDVVEMHDPNSHDPKLLVYFKSYRNSVPVPKHWSQKRKYLQGKRGVEKPAFRLPTFIENTGIGKIRSAQQAIDAEKKLKQKQRERMAPKTGKIDIDYQILHDAFFRHQTKPEMTRHGDVYYEGKEFELKVSETRPGELSEKLMQALGMRGKTSPPPWLRNMQRYGPPPSYPNLRIPGVNCPIPPGAKYGLNEGEWGRPPVNEFGQSIWGGDIYGTGPQEEPEPEVIVDRTSWGLLEVEEEEEEEQPEEATEQETAAEEGGDREEELNDEDMQSGIESTTSAAGLVTPEIISLRKRDGTGTETPDTQRGPPRTLYQVLEQKDVGVDQRSILGTDKTYIIPGAEALAASQAMDDSESLKRKRAGKADVVVQLAPEDLATLDAEALKKKYQEQLDAERAAKATMRADADDDMEDDSRKKKRKTDSGKKEKFKF